MFHLITGGSGSGKSEYAEQKLMEYASHSKRNKKRYYIATMMPFGKETEEKIARHRRPVSYTHLDVYKRQSVS